MLSLFNIEVNEVFGFFFCENNIVTAAIVGGATAAIAITMIALMFTVFKNNSRMTMFATFACVLSAVVATLFCYNVIVVVGYLLSVVAIAIGLTKWSQYVHQNTIYTGMSFTHRFMKFLIPVAVFFQMSRPFFLKCKNEGDIGYYSFWSSLGLRSHNVNQNRWSKKWTDVVVEGYEPFNLDWENMSIVTFLALLLFFAILAMQVVLIWRQFVDPDNARDWADAGILVTCIGVLFVYGLFTSNGFSLIDTTAAENDTLVIYELVILGVINWLLYLGKVENFLDNIVNKKGGKSKKEKKSKTVTV